MSRRANRRWFAGAALAVLIGVVLLQPKVVRAQQEEITRKVKTKVSPTYPDLARRMSISGVVKVQVVVGQPFVTLLIEHCP